MPDPLLYCLLLLKRRPRSQWELEQALMRKGFPDEEQQGALVRLRELKLVDDRAFAEAWVRNRDVLAPRGRHLLQAELVKKGISKEIITEVLSRALQAPVEDKLEEGRPSEEMLAAQLLKGKERLYRHLAPEVRQRRLFALLQRRGFSYETIRRILEA